MENEVSAFQSHLKGLTRFNYCSHSKSVLFSFPSRK